ncbi:MAG: hypothetical protein GTO24_06505 [candidate division Zixibacteria bacterium]|nr:hypothetical protein [candidate division Zixibacteria bacterium]
MTSRERFWKAVHLEEPDRVPVSPYIVYLAAALAGMKPAEFGWSVDKTHQALFKTYEYFDKEIDALHIMCMRFAYTNVFPSAYSTLYFNWEFPIDSIPQFVQTKGEYGEDLYDQVLEEGFTYLIPSSRIQIDKVVETYSKEALIHREWMRRWGEEDIVNLAGPMTTIPSDLLIYARGAEGFLDLVLHPEKLKAVNDAMTPGMIAVNKFLARRANSNIQRISVQNFTADMVSPKTFEELCWPWMKKAIEEFLAEEDCTIILHLDGNWKPLYPFFQDFPPKRIIMELEFSDMKEAKKILGKTVCLKGNVSCTDLAFAPANRIQDVCKQLIDDCASGGGFILSSGCEAPVDSKPENIEAMIDTASTYGKY